MTMRRLLGSYGVGVWTSFPFINISRFDNLKVRNFQKKIIWNNFSLNNLTGERILFNTCTKLMSQKVIPEIGNSNYTKESQSILIWLLTVFLKILKFELVYLHYGTSKVNSNYALCYSLCLCMMNISLDCIIWN